MEKIKISIEEARVILRLNETHKRNLFREDYDQLMEIPIRTALEELNREDNPENREDIINRATIYFTLLEIN